MVRRIYSNGRITQIQLTRRELGLFKHYSHLLFANIDDDVTPDGCSCTGSFPIEKDWFGKDAITNLYRKVQNYYRHSL